MALDVFCLVSLMGDLQMMILKRVHLYSLVDYATRAMVHCLLTSLSCFYELFND